MVVVWDLESSSKTSIKSSLPSTWSPRTAEVAKKYICLDFKNIVVCTTIYYKVDGTLEGLVVAMVTEEAPQ